MGFFTSEPINLQQGVNYNPNLTTAFFNALGAQGLYQQPNGGWSFWGAKQFDPNDPQGQQAKNTLTVNPSQQLQKAWGAWQPWDGGTSYLANYITNNSGMSAPFATAMGNMAQYGAQSGYPGEMMHQMAAYGGTTPNSPGASAMRAMLDYGAASQVGQYVSNMAQFGVPSAAGSYLAQRAAGGGPSMNFLNPFLGMAQGQRYQAPQIQARQLSRLGTTIPGGYNFT